MFRVRQNVVENNKKVSTSELFQAKIYFLWTADDIIYFMPPPSFYEQ